ncbi:MAG: hypothetical protein P8H43_00065 [Crocinitomicaceae bacterium]|jgi:hypothetical protein|nr:hypothetical protein [Crocinitomicaceae bacterium]
MILNTTHLDKEKKILIEDTVGSAKPLLKSIFFGSRGSHRMIIDSHSESFKRYIRATQDSLYASIEIRKKGIILRISANYNTISWLVPFHQLSIYKSTHFSIHAAGEFIKFRMDKNYKMNKSFIASMLEEKSNFPGGLENSGGPNT